MTNNNRRQKRRTRARATPMAVALMLAVIVPWVKPWAQSFSSGSDGSDGALTISPNQGSIIFDPTDVTRWGRSLDSDGDGVYNFTMITIGAGSTLKLRGDIVNRPVYWLATGDVVIAGTLDAAGAPGVQTRDLNFRRVGAVPGAGGFAGGAGGISTLSVPATPGDGPGGGTGGLPCQGSSICGNGGTYSGNGYAIPLVGGSGGQGALIARSDASYNGGGAGGGAILIGSSTSISVSGTVTAAGGSPQFDGCCGTLAGGGSGGVIRLVAPVVTGSGVLNVSGGDGNIQGVAGKGGPGIVRLEAFQNLSSFTFAAGSGFVTRGSPVDQATLRPASSIRVTAIDGIPVPANSSGSFALPDVTINSTSPVSVDITSAGIPPGTVVTLQVFPQTPTDVTIVNLPTAQATLGGTLQSSTARATFTFPYGFSRGFVRATWTQ
jgi:hypothetical protein